MRRKRILCDGAIYHVVAQINRQEYVFNKPDIKALFLRILKRTRKKYRFDLKNFCVMSNHVHLLIQPKAGNSLSEIMQWLLSVFAKHYNKRLGIRGHVWYDRFKSKIIKSYHHYIYAFDYISKNPIRAGILKEGSVYVYSGLFYILTKQYQYVDPPDPIIFFYLHRYGK